ncbi:MAG: beta-galactosidase [Spirochaetes bacterium]|nr:beta-galactosidase [Spirochaetota bacterium]
MTMYRNSALFVVSCVFSIMRLMADQLPVTQEQLERKGSAEISLQANDIMLKIDDPGWDSGVRIKPPAGQPSWDLSKFKVLSVDVENLSPDKQLRLTMHIASGSKEQKNFRTVNTGIGLNPGEKRAMRLSIPHRTLYGAPQGVPGRRVLDTDTILWIEIYMQWPFEPKTRGLVDCRLSNLRAEEPVGDEKGVSKENYLPFVDQYGQFMHADWPEKIRSDSELQARHAAELKQLAAVKRCAEWNEYGGWKNGPQLQATGFFRTEKYQGKWYFVDPSGRLFFSHGIDVLYAHTDATKSTGHETWFNFTLPASGELPFTHFNLQKKYGKEGYEPEFFDTLSRRLEAWGVNSIGNWGSTNLMSTGRIPYTLQISDYNAKLPRIAGSKLKFYDVFDPAYIAAMKTLVSDRAEKHPQTQTSLTDRMCIGYFIDNELDFGNRGRLVFIEDVMKAPARQAAKQQFVSDCRQKYGSIDSLNASWKTGYADWDALLNATDMPKSDAFKDDGKAFHAGAVDQYFRLCRDAIKSVAPHRLYLGTRFIGTDAVRKVLYDASAKYCDVLTVNLYSHSAANLTAPDFPDMPVLIGEFHFGTYDRGMFSASLCPAGITQDERALAYLRYAQGAIAHPNIVGVHWFQFRDQPLTGRWDGEGYQLGFVDVADTPYTGMTKTAREIGDRMYAARANTSNRIGW